MKLFPLFNINNIIKIIYIIMTMIGAVKGVSLCYVCLFSAEAGPLPAKAPLAGTHILMIICAILFLTMLLLGLGVSYLCLRRRALPAPRRFIDDSSASIVSRESIQGISF